MFPPYFPLSRYYPTQGLHPNRNQCITASNSASVWGEGYESLNKTIEKKLEPKRESISDYLQRKLDKGNKNEPYVIQQVLQRLNAVDLKMTGYWDMGFTGSTPDAVIALRSDNPFSPLPAISLLEVKTTEREIPSVPSYRFRSQVLVQMITVRCPNALIAIDQMVWSEEECEYTHDIHMWKVEWGPEAQRYWELLEPELKAVHSIIKKKKTGKYVVKSNRNLLFKNVLDQVPFQLVF